MINLFFSHGRTSEALHSFTKNPKLPNSSSHMSVTPFFSTQAFLALENVLLSGKLNKEKRDKILYCRPIAL